MTYHNFIKLKKIKFNKKKYKSLDISFEKPPLVTIDPQNKNSQEKSNGAGKLCLLDKDIFLMEEQISAFEESIKIEFDKKN